MTGWPVQDFLRRTGARVPIVQAPMAGAGGVALAAAAIRGGAVGSLPCAMLTPDQVREQVAQVRAQAEGPINLNFFCHTLGEAPDETAWRDQLRPFYVEEGVGPPLSPPPLRAPFDSTMCDVVLALRPAVVSFHFGLPEPGLLERIRNSGITIIGNATTMAEAWELASSGVDMIIAQGFEAGGHAGHFLDGYRPEGTLALTRRISAGLNGILTTVIATGGIGDAEGIAAALTLGAGAVQLGTAYLHTPEATISAAHRAALGQETVVTNLFSGGLARGVRNRLIDTIGPVHPAAPRFPYASAALAELRRVAEADGRGDYSPMWAGQAASLGRPLPGQPPEGAQALTERLARETFELLGEAP